MRSEGIVQEQHALLKATFRLPGQGDLSVECVVDTGFTDSLCLPVSAVEALGFSYQFEYPARLADGSVVYLPVYEASLVWLGRERRVHLLATGT